MAGAHCSRQLVSRLAQISGGGGGAGGTAAVQHHSKPQCAGRHLIIFSHDLRRHVVFLDSMRALPAGGSSATSSLLLVFHPSFGLLLPGIPDWCQRGTLESVAAAAAAAAAATAILTQLRRPPTTPACPSQRDVQASAWPRPSCLGCSIECIDWGGSLMRVGSTTERDGRAPAGPWAGGGGGSEWEWGYTGDRYDYHLNLAEWHLCAL